MSRFPVQRLPTTALKARALFARGDIRAAPLQSDDPQPIGIAG
jgi:hypothetical protein